MKKYYLKSDNTPVEFGEMIELDLVKVDKEGKKQMKHIKCQFLPELAPLLLEGDILVEKEVEAPEEEDQAEGTLDDYMEKIADYMVEITNVLHCFEDRISKLEKRAEKAPQPQPLFGSQLRKVFPKVVEVHAFTL